MGHDGRQFNRRRRTPEADRSSLWRRLAARVWGSFSSPQKWGGALVLTLLAALFAAGVGGVFNGDDADVTSGPSAAASSQAHSASPPSEADVCASRAKSARGQRALAASVCAKPFWTEPPTLYGVSFLRSSDPAFAGLANILGAEVEVLSVERLVQDAADYAGKPTFVVGRVQRDDLVAEDQREVRLVGRDPTYALVVRDTAALSRWRRGDILTAPVYVAARGVARFTGARATVDAAFALGDFLESADAHSDSPPIAREVRRLSE